MVKKTTRTPKEKKTTPRTSVKKGNSKGNKKSTKNKKKPTKSSKVKEDIEAKQRELAEKTDRRMRKWLGTDNASQEASSMDEGVGYCNPPRHSQFKPGTSGNPKGRPKGSKNVATIVHEIGSIKVKLKNEGQDEEMSMMEALIYKSFLRAINEGQLDLVTFLTQKYDRSVGDIAEDKKLEQRKFMDRRALFERYVNEAPFSHS